MGTRKSVATILSQAADILEKRGFTTSRCWDEDSGGYCALGAIARAAYPKARNEDIDDIAYNGVESGVADRPADPRYVQAVTIAAQTAARRKNLAGLPAQYVYTYNDGARTPGHVVKMLRRAAVNAAKAAVK